MSIRIRLRQLAATLTLPLLLLTTAPGAAAVSPPDPNMYTPAPPADTDPKPPAEMKQQAQCAQSAVLQGTNFTNTPPANDAFNVDELHKYATGRGVKVAVIDSGVNPSPRLPRLEGLGDYITDTDGLVDCDHHGTLVAGIIGAQPSADDKFVGVAPGVDIMSIRQTSRAYKPKDAKKGEGSSTLATAAAAIVHAVNKGANVINLSVTACYAADSGVDTSDLAAALKYAYQRNVVVVTSAGNADADGCDPNPQYDPAHPSDARNWAGVQHMSMPSYYNPFLISVGGSTLTGEPYSNTMAGPWVGVAAPAVNIVSLDPESHNGGLVNASMSDKGPQAYNGTSFSAAYITGLVALLKERYPKDNLDQLKARIYRTAHPASDGEINTIGFGVADPVAALTQQVDTSLPQVPAHTPSQLAGGSRWKDHGVNTQLLITLIVCGVIILSGVLGYVVWMMFNTATKLDRRASRGRSPREINAQRRETRRRAREARRSEKKRQKDIRKQRKG